MPTVEEVEAAIDCLDAALNVIDNSCSPSQRQTFVMRRTYSLIEQSRDYLTGDSDD